ncbi:MAG TPA: protein-methionine-sulfoxide reductase heme-binding subunit MsrQ, partial [Acidobacteriota bacterium]|nr:protein-methionine-sulfoxide reductase heme-binding subunit MsrQ [Acidobacteriota bacterium]
MRKERIILIKSVIWVVCLAPLLRLGYKALTGGLTANPIEFITLSTGTWTLVFVMATLGITPLRQFTGQNWLIKLRRLIGLHAFFYGLLHFVTYIWLDKFFDLRDMAHDVLKRPFITAGFFAFVLMVPLAATSTAGAIRRLGGRKWQLLHRLIYLTGLAGVVHFWWKVKADTRQPEIYAIVLAILMGCRISSWLMV